MKKIASFIFILITTALLTWVLIEWWQRAPAEKIIYQGELPCLSCAQMEVELIIQGKHYHWRGVSEGKLIFAGEGKLKRHGPFFTLYYSKNGSHDTTTFKVKGDDLFLYTQEGLSDYFLSRKR